MSGVDTTPPVLTGLTFPTTIDVRFGGTATAPISASAMDDLSGVRGIGIELEHPIHTPNGPTDNLSFDFGGGQVFGSNFQVDGQTGAGTYNIRDIVLFDAAGNGRVYYPAELQAMGIATSFTVLSDTPADFSPPNLISYTLPSTIDLTHGDLAVAFTANVTDAGRGPDYLTLFVDLGVHVGVQPSQTAFGIPLTANGVTNGSLLFHSDTPSGTYTITGGYVRDAAGNGRNYTAAQLSALGVPLTFNVVSNVVADHTPPTLLGFTVPERIDISHGDTFAPISAQASDVGLGVKFVTIGLDGFIQGAVGPQAGFYLPVGAGGQLSINDLVRGTTTPGAYRIDVASVEDFGGTRVFYSAAQLRAMGAPIALWITDGRPDPATVSMPASAHEGDAISGAIAAANGGRVTGELTYVVESPGGRQIGTFTLDSFGTGAANFRLPSYEDAVQGAASWRISGFVSAGGTNFAFNRSGSFVDNDSADFTVNVTGLSQAFSNIARIAAPGQLAQLGMPDSPRAAVALLEPLLLNTTSVAVMAYAFFAGVAPSPAGLDYLLSPTGPNANNLNSAYYAAFNTENRYINFAANLGLHGQGAAAFQAAYGNLSFHDAVVRAYGEIVGATPNAAAAIASIEASLPYFQAIAHERMSLDDPNLAVKAAAIGYLLQEAARANLGAYAHALENFYIDLADGTAQGGVSLIGTYGAGTFVDTHV